jgi:hypothetical protein
MAVNPFFRDSTAEQRLLNDLTIETIRAMGRDMIYIPRNYVNLDELFGEDIQNKFTDAYAIEMYIKNVMQFDGQGDVISKFGINITDRVSLVLSKTRFEQEITTKDSEIKYPRVGDLVYFPLSNSLFEINYVNKRDPFYQFGTLTTYTLECELFSYSNEEITTGISDIDTIEDDRKEYALKMFIGVTAQDPVYGYYYAGETLYQVSGISGAGATLANATATATLVEQTDGITYDILYLGNVSGTFVTGSGETIKGANSGAEFEVQQTTTTNVLIQKDPTNTTSADKDNDILQFKNTSQGIFDFTETDPFSEGRY